VATIC